MTTKRSMLHAVLGGAIALVLLFGGLGVSMVSAQEPAPGDAPGCGVWGWARGFLGFGRAGQLPLFDTAADVLGLTPVELFSEMHAGKTIEEVAEAQGVEVDALREALSQARDEAMRDAIAEAVEEGEMSHAQADWLLEGMEQGFVPHGRVFLHGFGRRMHRGPSRGGFWGR